MSFSDLRHEQSRQTIDVEQVYAAFVAADAELGKRFSGSMFWRDIEGRAYLYRKTGGLNRSLGPRSVELECVYQAFHQGRDTLRERVKGLAARLNEMAPVNRALGLGRMPALSARILRRAAGSGLIGKATIVVGTTALFAYERMAAVHVASGLLATGDIDLLFDARHKLKLAGELRPHGLLGLLRKVDHSFEASPGAFRAVNGDGFMVDLIEPAPRNRLRPRGRTSIGDADDLQAVEIEGLAWLLNSPKHHAVVLDERGYPLEMVVPDPRAFALHKAWLSARDDREPIKRRRDLAQAQLVAQLATERLALSFEASDLSALPATMRSAAGDLLLPERPSGLQPDW